MRVPEKGTSFMTDFKFEPRKTALLNIDMQNCFVENSPVAAPRGREILPRINKLGEVCRKFGLTANRIEAIETRALVALQSSRDPQRLREFLRG